MVDWSTLVESGRAIAALPRLGRAEAASRGPEDWKFAMGDLLANLDEDLTKDELERLAKELGQRPDGDTITGDKLRSYRDVSRAWPAEERVAASWTTHRTIATRPDRFDLIRPGMTLREAQEASGKNRSDVAHPSRWSIKRRVDFVVNELQTAETAAAARADLEERKKARAARAIVRMAEEERSAEYKEALRQFREARDAKHPERAAYDALFKLREAREFVRAVHKATLDEDSFLPAHMRPNLVEAVRDLGLMSVRMIASLRDLDDSAADALDDITQEITQILSRQVETTFSGMVIPGEVEVPE